MEKSAGTRRQFIATLVLAIPALLLGRKYLTPKRRTEQRTLALARSQLPGDGALVYREARMAVVSSKGNLYALGLVCTHLGCTVSVTPEEVVCPCHGSRFDREGNVLQGPADKPLRRYPVEVTDKHFIVLLHAPLAATAG